MRVILVWALVGLVCWAGALGCSDAGGAAAPSGEALYSEPHGDGNTFACATCHALQEPASDGIRRPGHAIGDAANRPSFKNAQLEELLAAVSRMPFWAADRLSDGELRDLIAFVLVNDGGGAEGSGGSGGTGGMRPCEATHPSIG